MLGHHFVRSAAIVALGLAVVGYAGIASAAYNLKPPNPRNCTSANIGQVVTTSYVAAPYTFYETYRCAAPFTWEWIAWKRCHPTTGCENLQLP